MHQVGVRKADCVGAVELADVGVVDAGGAAVSPSAFSGVWLC